MTTRVMHVVSSAHGSLLRQFALLAEGLDPHEFELCSVLLGRRAAVDAAAEMLAAVAARRPLEVRNVAGRSGFDPHALLELKRALDTFRPRVVHAVGRGAARCADSACRAAGIREFVVSAAAPERQGWWDRFLDRLVANRASRIVVTSAAAKKPFATLRGASEKLQVIPWGVEAPGVAAHGFTPHDVAQRDVAPQNVAQQDVAQQDVASPRAGLLKSLALPAGSRLIGTAGPLESRQRVKDLIWAADLLKCVRDDVHLLVFGDGPQQWRLERYRRQVEITDRVHFLEGGIDRPPLEALDCFWLAAADDELSLPLLEAMAGAVPVVAADTPTSREFIELGQNGYLAAIGDRAAFARRTNVLLDDGQLARRIGEAGKAAVLERFPLGRMIERHAALYRELT